jgi:hypothetical protein
MRSSPRSPSSDPVFKKCSQFGDHITADLKTFWLDKKSWGMDGQKCVLVVCDAFTGFIQSYPLVENSADNVVECYLNFAGNNKIKYVYCDGGPELVKAAKQIKANCDIATPNSPKNNSVAEEKIKRVLYASRTLLEHAGMPPMYWPYSVKAASMGMNVVGGTRSPYYLKHGVAFAGKFIPFGCLIDYLPSSKVGAM